MTGLAALIVRSRIGQTLIAIRQNEKLVGAIGIAAWKYKLFAFVASAMYAGLAGALYAHYQSFINPEIFGACPVTRRDPCRDHRWFGHHRWVR